MFPVAPSSAPKLHSITIQIQILASVRVQPFFDAQKVINSGDVVDRVRVTTQQSLSSCHSFVFLSLWPFFLRVVRGNRAVKGSTIRKFFFSCPSFFMGLPFPGRLRLFPKFESSTTRRLMVFSAVFEIYGSARERRPEVEARSCRT
ncbi:hypothetical protein L596_022636 [Steinernema carpocapsae]|uniref:Uncharacterized protein n=1 Tax=Steinernema carpocapsae TaxID=34508 RepID=A0A4V6A0J5_STECR|nr:hypothetical protein L596_022636 [Steinernema carpocapsae]